MSDHKDDLSINNFANELKIKMKKSREKGRSGWEDPEKCSTETLCHMTIEHMQKGNPGTFEDIGAFAMMLHQRGDDPLKLKEILGLYIQ